MSLKIAAFVAKSFDPADERKIEPIVKLLDSFKPLGFIAESADRGEVESVSEKVRGLIDKSDVLVGIFTRRHAIYRFSGRLNTAWSSLLGKLVPYAWSAPPWVLQESGYALKANKALILFRETGVEIPGLQGDLEYIAFDPLNPSSALQRANEMIADLIARVGGIRVETVVQAGIADTKKVDEAVSPKPSETVTAPTEATTEEGIRVRVVALWRTINSGSEEEARLEYSAGLDWLRAHDPKEECFWKCFYERRRFAAGQSDALAELRELVEEYPADPLPQAYMAASLAELREYDEAIQRYLAAAQLAVEGGKAQYELDAAELLQRANRPMESREILLRLRAAEYAKDARTQFRVLQQLYSLTKEFEDQFPGFAIGELALHHRPEETTFRFSLAYDYGEANQSQMAIYHYKIICEQDEKNAGALNNLGIALASAELPILAVQRYKQSYALGETLAASNLARKYLDAGLTDDAIRLLKEAQAREDCTPEVSGALSLVHQRVQQSSQDQEDILVAAEKNRNFLLMFATAYFSEAVPNLQGRWSFPIAEIDLELKQTKLRGVRENRTREQRGTSLASIFAELGGPKQITKIESIKFSGTMSGRACKFKLQISRREEPSGSSILGAPSDSKLEGYIVFGEDGESGNVLEVSSGRPNKYYKISKVV